MNWTENSKSKDGKEMTSISNFFVWMCMEILVGIKEYHLIPNPVWMYKTWN
jgi:hypothetical protein